MKGFIRFIISFLTIIGFAYLIIALPAQAKSNKPHKAVCPSEGKDSFRCHAHVIVTDKGIPDVQKQALVGASGPYGPVQFQTAYALNGNANGRILAIVDAYDDPHMQSDLATYEAGVGLPSLPSCTSLTDTTPCFEKVNQNGTTVYPQYDSGWALEESLDVETANAACPSCKIVLVEANSSYYSDLLTAVDRAVAMGATVVSNSYGSREFSGEKNYDYHFKKLGVAFTFSAGDNGYGTAYPAASPFVTSVGGTSLYLNNSSSRSSEIVWSGTGSGCSRYETRPVWQVVTGGYSRRIMNDVSADADPNTGAAVYDADYYGYSGWFEVGGTSLSAPLIAAAYALHGIPGGYTRSANSLPYYFGSSANLYDVTSGNDAWWCSNVLCSAKPGFDGPTGLGTPEGTSAF